MAPDDRDDLNDPQMAEVIRELTRIFTPHASAVEPPSFDVAFAVQSPSDTLEFLRSIPTGTPPEKISILAREFERSLARRLAQR